MAKVDKVENKDQKVEKSSKKVNKSSYSKKKKIKKNILNGIAYVQSTFNNTIISIADTNGNVISWGYHRTLLYKQVCYGGTQRYLSGSAQV